MQKKKIMTPILDIVMVADTCDDLSIDSCDVWVVKSVGGSHMRLLLVALFTTCMGQGVIPCQLPTNNKGNMVFKVAKGSN
jgi:hypothetical protein